MRARVADVPLSHRGMLLTIALSIFLAITSCGSRGGGSTGPLSPESNATITVSGTNWGVGTQYIGVNEGDQYFNINDLKDLGVNTYRIYGGMSRWEAQDDDGIFGWPTIAEIKADPNVIHWAWWDNIMTNPPRGSDYWWTGASGVWQGNARILFQALRDNGIKPVVVLRNVDDKGNPAWANTQLNPPLSPAAQAEWWEHVFATVYWFNVRNDYRVDDWEIHNEPDNTAQGWRGTQADYIAFAHLTADAIRYVYSKYLPGRTPHIYAPGTVTGSTWPQALMQQAPGDFDSVDIHDYDNDITAYVTRVRGWMSSSAFATAPLWLSEWSTYQEGQYANASFSVSNIVRNLIIGCQPGNTHVDGSHLFSLYDWGTGSYGLIGHGRVPRSGYYAMRLAIRGLQGGRPTYQSASSNNDITAITTKNATGHYWVLLVNTSNTAISVTLNLSALLTTGAGTMWEFDGIHYDAEVGNAAVSDGKLKLRLNGEAAYLLEF